MIPRNTPNLSQSSTKAPSIVESPFNTILIKRNPHKSEHGSDSKSKSSLLSRSSKTLSMARSLFSGPSVRSHISENESASVHESKSSITSHSSNSSDSRSCQKPRHCSQRKPSSKKQLSSLLNAIISITQVGIQPKKSLPPTTKSREEEADGPIFNVTIEESASISCKNGIPDIVVQCVEYLERKQVLQTEGLYRVPGSQKREGDILPSSEGFPVLLDNETPATIASLLKKFFASVKDQFIPDEFWTEMDAIALECGSNLPSQELWSRVKRTFEDHFRSRQHLHTVAYFLLHLQRVASYSKTNKMTAKNLATCVFITAKEGGEFVINHADFIFGNIDFIGQETVSFLPFSETRNVAHILPNWGSEFSNIQPQLIKDWFKSFMPQLFHQNTAIAQSQTIPVSESKNNTRADSLQQNPDNKSLSSDFLSFVTNASAGGSTSA